MAERDADSIFKEFKEHSITEFFKKNRQMLGYAGKVRSLTTIVHEYVSNSLDACEEAGTLPEICVEIKETGEDKYSIKVEDNGPGIPKAIVGKALATVLAGTKFHRYAQQRGQQGIGAASCTLFSLITTNRPVHAKSVTATEAFECDIGIDVKSNKPKIENMRQIERGQSGLSVTGEFGDVKYENSDHGVYEYLKRTVLVNPHVSIRLIEPGGDERIFPRSANSLPKRTKAIKPHPLGLTPHDLLEFAQLSTSRKLSSFLTETFARFTYNKVEEIKTLDGSIDMEKDPKTMTWDESEKLVKAFKKVKWMAPEMDALSVVGEAQIKAAIHNILNPQFLTAVERSPKVFRGGVPFVVEAGIAYGGDAAQSKDGIPKASILRFANKVPLLFDSTNCAITDAVRSIDWRRYKLAKFEEEPIVVIVNVSSVYIPYSGVGKQAVSQEEAIIQEIRLAIQEAARGLQMYISGQRSRNLQEDKYKTIMRYVDKVAEDLSELTGEDRGRIGDMLKSIINHRYKAVFGSGDTEGQIPEAT
jgi:DNA topoisomerase-6 subunit B